MRARLILLAFLALAPLAASGQAPSSGDAWGQALARLDADDVAGARALALALPPGTPARTAGRGLYVLGRIQLEDEQVDAALASLEKAAKGMPGDPDVLYWHGIACHEKTERCR